jgi:hypothetical protein
MKRKIVVLLLVMTMVAAVFPMSALAASEPGIGYSDISGTWFTDAAASYGYPEIFKGADGKFNPNSKITRIEFVQLLHKALGININYFAAPDVRDDFDDMENTDAGANALIDLVTAGIIERGGSFKPEGQLDREVMIQWTIKALDQQTGGDYAMIMIMPAPFDDDKDITDAYRENIVKSVVLGLVFGRGSNMLFPKDGATRAEAVTIVSRLISLLDSLQTDVNVTASAWLVKGGALTMSLVIENNTKDVVTLNHTSGQKYDFKLFDDKGENVYTWSADKMFIAALGTTELQPGEKIEFSDMIDSGAYPGISTAVTMTAYIVGTSDDFTITENGYTATIVK